VSSFFNGTLAQLGYTVPFTVDVTITQHAYMCNTRQLKYKQINLNTDD